MKMMVVSLSRCKIFNVHFPSSLGTFVKHLQLSKPKTLFLPQRPSFKPLTTNTTDEIRCSSHFETLTSSQKEQIHLYVDALLQWNQVPSVKKLSKVFNFLFFFLEIVEFGLFFSENESYGCQRS